MKFVTQTYGKWILCGEHAVLRGCPAIVFPLTNFHLNLQYETSPNTFKIETNTPTYINDFSKTWKYAIDLLPTVHKNLLTSGILKIHSTIPIGQGMGASAALSLAIARCLIHLTHSSQDPWIFAKNIENLFHGQSSGLDILGVGSLQGELLEGETHRPLNLSWMPCWALSSSHEIGKTQDTIKNVKIISIENPQLANQIDASMKTSVEMALHALEDKSENISLLADSMKLAHDCFKQWNLITPNMRVAIERLYQEGALAVKPTGSGGGGYLLSLWASSTFQKIDKQTTLIQINQPIDNMFHRL